MQRLPPPTQTPPDPRQGHRSQIWRQPLQVSAQGTLTKGLAGNSRCCRSFLPALPSWETRDLWTWADTAKCDTASIFFRNAQVTCAVAGTEMVRQLQGGWRSLGRHQRYKNQQNHSAPELTIPSHHGYSAEARSAWVRPQLQSWFGLCCQPCCWDRVVLQSLARCLCPTLPTASLPRVANVCRSLTSAFAPSDSDTFETGFKLLWDLHPNTQLC